MAVMKKIKKGGVARYTLFGVQQNDSFTVPRGFRIRYIGVESLATSTAAVNFGIGVVPGVFPVQTLTTNGTAVGGSGTTVTIDNIAVTIVQLDTAVVVMDKIMAAYAAGSFTNAATTSTQSWTMVRTSPTVITITGSAPAAVAGVSIAVGSITGFTLTAAQVAAGSVDVTVVNSTAMSAYRADTPGQNSVVAGTVQANFDYIPGSHSPNIYNTFSSYSSSTVGTFIVNGYTFTPKTAGTADIAGIAAACAAAVNASTPITGLMAFTTATSGQLVVTYAPIVGGNTPSTPLTYNYAGITGATVGTITATKNSADITYYVSMSGRYLPQVVGTPNMYIILDKLN
jgi:hypothetical protein